MIDILYGIVGLVAVILAAWFGGKRVSRKETAAEYEAMDEDNAEKVKEQAQSARKKIDASWENIHGSDVRGSAIERLRELGRLRD